MRFVASTDDSNGTDLESSFDAEDEVEETDYDTNPTDVDTDIEGGTRQTYRRSVTRTTSSRQNTTSIKKRTLTRLVHDS
jgi:hypothetical protein